MKGIGHRKEALALKGTGRGMDNKKSRTTKRNHDRRVDKRRRQQDQGLLNEEMYDAMVRPRNYAYHTPGGLP